MTVATSDIDQLCGWRLAREHEIASTQDEITIRYTDTVPNVCHYS